MAKRSKKRPIRQNKDHPGCMWGLISMFDFRHGRTTRRLLSDRRNMAKNTIGHAYPIMEVNLLTDSEELHVRSEGGGESEPQTFDLNKTSVKELMEEEMVSEQGSKKQKSSDEVELFESECGDHVKNRKHTGKTFKRSFDVHEISSRNLDLEALVKELVLIHKKRNDWDGDLDAGSNRTYSMIEEKLSAAIEVFMNEESIDGLTENGKTQHSKDSADAFQMLSSNKELFLKLLQDQNSLSPMHSEGTENAHSTENQKSKSIARTNSFENEPSDPRPKELVTHKHRNFFRKRSKSLESISLKGNDSPQHSSRIVILKPGSPDNRIKKENEVTNERNPSQFSFMEIKRRLKHAMGKDQPRLEDSEKVVSEGSSGWSSPNRNHFYTERFAKISNGLRKKERVSKLKEPETKLMENEESGDANRRISDIYIEAKKHLSEMLSGGDKDAELMMGSLPNTLGRILSLPEYNSLSPCGSPRKERVQGIVTTEMGLSPRGNSHMVNESQPCVTNDSPEEQVQVPDEVNHDNSVGANPSSTRDEMNSEGVTETVDSPDAKNQEIETLDVSCERPSNSLNIIDEDLHDEVAEASDDEKPSQSLKLELPEENEPSSPTASPAGSSSASKQEELESISSDRAGRPSPISVLEPLFSDDDISPASSISRPVEAAIQPICIQFEENVSLNDQEIYIRNCMDNEESAFEYVEAVLLASDLNWDDFEKRWLSSVQILDPSLFDEVKIFSNRPSHDQRLLFGAANEILKEVCDRYLGFFLELSYTKRNIQPVPKGMSLINEVWETIDTHLHSHYPRSLDQLVKTDFARLRMWMDLRSETRELVFEIEESVFEDMLEDTLFSLLKDCIDHEILSE